MTQTISEEPKHIPNRPDYDIQNEFHVLYNMSRRKDVKLERWSQQTIEHCIAFLKKDYPGWNPNFDKNYFGTS